MSLFKVGVQRCAKYSHQQHYERNELLILTKIQQHDQKKIKRIDGRSTRNNLYRFTPINSIQINNDQILGLQLDCGTLGSRP